MISYIRGSLKGKRLAGDTANLCKEIVNYLIKEKIGIQLPDTAYIFQESYTLCQLLHTKPKMNKTITGVMIETSKSILKEWLLKVFMDAKGNYDFNEGVDDVIKKFPTYTLNWAKELTNEHSDLIGKNINLWIPAITEQFINHIRSYIIKKFGEEPDNIRNTLMNYLYMNVRILRVAMKQ
jgi:hypothetical protein